MFVLMARKQASYASPVPALADVGEERILRGGGWQPSSTMVRAAKGEKCEIHSVLWQRTDSWSPAVSGLTSPPGDSNALAPEHFFV